MTADYAARVRTLAARHNREWQLLVEEMDRERTAAALPPRSIRVTEQWVRDHPPIDDATFIALLQPSEPHAEAEEHA